MSRTYLAAYILFCALIAVAVWMIGYALILQFVYKDSRILHLTVTANPFAPLQQFWLYSGNRALQVAALGALVPAIAVAAGAGIFGLRRPSNPLGDAAFQDIASIRRGKWFRKEGHIFGKMGRNILRRMDDRHHLVIGPTRSGKGVGYVIPNALMFSGSMIVTDLKGEIYQHTAGYRKANGHQVFLFSPGASQTHRWNPMDFVRQDRGSRTIDIQNMASILIPETLGSDNAVWQGTAQQVIAGVISYVLESSHYRNRRNLGEVNSIFNAGVDLQVLMKLIKEKEPDLSRFTTDSFNAYISLNERAARSALLDIQKSMQPFRNERVIAATSVTDIDLASMRRRPVSIYLAPNISDVTILRPLLTLFVQQSMDLLTRDFDPSALPAYFLLDEFRQLKRMDEIMNKLPYVAGYNIKMAFIIQDLKSLDEIYGETSRHSLLGNCGLQLILGANDQATAEYASRALGKKTIRYKSESRTLELMGLPRRTKIEQIRERDLMMPQEVRQMPEDRMLLLVEGQRAIFGQKLRFHEVAEFKTAAQYAAENQPTVPDAELVSLLQVPAVAETGGDVSPPSGGEHAQAPGDAADTEIPVVVAKALKLAPNKKGGINPGSGFTQGPPASPNNEAVEKIESKLVPTALRLREAVDKKLMQHGGVSARSRRSVAEILKQTVPDPAEVGFV
ncbi:type IV secretory system conjugative DNA transfer family protein [Agrobacterium tumefaciens]|uniref:Type IV secretory system conjugative DNA transfer family protein n=1 Tax=Agrobacterium tumefaciens TaxID=358 RepID=A0AA44F6R1_AGRTU|nr:type IV secretory system conjugative DNA transfer family protein [Agrobacterium tumefaciens]NTB87668.1 type IV secretory system conjugative DNA transfer family protein [Agrobacterium tumefaciens]NTC19964.1 type IV secretory system conjugative DNA transfer family protein [Agrobacterium tumefaciens]NTC29783.1 type IV secretory system conjugative DNA transfer family protein [Agrobacterium tumefaciens]